MGLPQYIWLALTFMGAGLALVYHGKPKEGTHNFFIGLFGTLLYAGLLYWGGFFG